MNPAWQQLIDQLAMYGALGPQARADWHRRAAAAPPGSLDEVEQLLAALAGLSRTNPPHEDALAAWSAAVDAACRALAGTPVPRGLSDQAIAHVRALYGRLAGGGAASSNLAGGNLARLLAIDSGPAALAAFAEMMVENPPGSAEQLLIAFAPLFQQRRAAPLALFPRLLDALAHPLLAGMVIDLSNFLIRRGLVAAHPALSRTSQLANLLGDLSNRLACLQERPGEFASSRQDLQRLVGDSVSLIVSLCDALGWMGNPSVAGKLYQAMALPHRRIRTEAAAALARLGDKRGVDVLVEMAAQPVARSRALAYLDELQLGQRAPQELRTAEARAAGELAAWLAEPTQYGLPPESIEVIDHCRQHWPGYSQRVDCYLVRYEYPLHGGNISGIGLAGPATSTVLADLADLPPSDIYAVYAGRLTEHEEISLHAAEDLSAQQCQAWEQARSRLEQRGFTDVRVAALGQFFGEDEWIATARHGERPGTVIDDGGQVHWHATSGGKRPLGWAEHYQLHKGRKLLGFFNA